MRLTKEMVALHAHICGDGNMYSYKENRSPSSKRTGRTSKPYFTYRLEYTNTCAALLDFVTYCIKKMSPESYVYRDSKKYRIQVRSKYLFLIMKELNYLNGERWLVPECIIEDSDFRKIWLRAFFDDEGSVYENYLTCSNTNHEAFWILEKCLIWKVSEHLCIL